jgi:hypothetical protein
VEIKDRKIGGSMEQPFPYTPDECLSLITDITEYYKTTFRDQSLSNLPGIVHYLKRYVEEGTPPYFNQRLKKFMLKISIDDIPMYLNHNFYVVKLIIKWRLRINK